MSDYKSIEARMATGTSSRVRAEPRAVFLAKICFERIAPLGRSAAVSLIDHAVIQIASAGLQRGIICRQEAT
jgi:hypothetical protein